MNLKALSIIVALLTGVAASRADITGNTLADDGDGVITCTTYGFLTLSPGEFQLSVDGIQHYSLDPSWPTGHILGDITTDTETDPSLTLAYEVDNDTGTAWNDYQVQITLNKSFTLSNVSVDNSGWTSVVTAPIQVGSSWIAYIDYKAGIPVPYDPDPLLTGTLDFGYKLSFTGSVTFVEALTPTFVPEPGTWALMACGLIGAFFMRRRSA